MSSVDIIKENIALVKTESEHKTLSVEQSINKFLDAINQTKCDIEVITGLTDELTELLWAHFESLTENDFEEFKNQLHTVIDKLNTFYRTIRNSKLYPGVKTVTREMHYSIDNLIEVYTDLVTFKIKLPKDEKFQELANFINEL